MSDWVKLNVGGEVFRTTVATLSKQPNSFLCRLVQKEDKDKCEDNLDSIKDECGAYLIDRDAHYFGPILNYLRHGKLVIDKNIAEEGVLEEAEFYNIPPLIALIRERIHDREHRGGPDGRQHVYRVLQCHEDELANLASTLSDGWRFEQILKIRADRSGGGFHPEGGSGGLGSGGQGQVELLCLVSKDYPASQANGETTEKAKSLQKQGSRM